MNDDLAPRIEELESAVDTLRGRGDATDRLLVHMHEDLVQRIDASKDELRLEMRTLNEETRRHMVVLHEDLVERIKRMSEAGGS